ncbi:MAG: efflux RND transporter periplasmic adaptor subunit, partial [Thermoanaerobaculia bacterium]
FGKKTNLIRAIEAAMDESHDQESTIVFPEPEGAEYRITRAHGELARRHGPGAVASIPLSGGSDARSAGVLTLERPAEKPFEGGEVALAEAAAALLGPSLEALRREERSLWAKGVEVGRRGILKLVGPRHPVLKLVVLGIAGAAAFFAFARGDFRVAAKSVLEGEVQRVVVAPFNGFISQAPARAGDVVREGQVLCVLDDRDLRLEEKRLESQREQYTKHYHQAMAQHNSAQVKIAAAQIDQVKAQLALVQDQLARMRVVSPFNGIVAKGDLSQSIGAPLERGQALFEVAPLDRYRLILEVDERDVTYVSAGLRGHLLLTSLPTQKLPFQVEKVTPVSQAREGRNYFRVEAKLDSPPERLRPGMEGVGKVEVDRRRFLWIWTHQAVDWLRLFFWSWTP